jgi:excisionase family DNA binding protein
MAGVCVLRARKKQENKMSDISAVKIKHIDVEEAAARIGITKFTLRRIVAERQIEHLRIGSGGGRILFTDAHINEYLRRRTVPVQEQAAA